MMLRNFVDFFTRVLGRIKRNQKIRLSGSNIKLNLGCGLAVWGDWINIDGSLNSFFANLPTFTHKLIYRLSGASQYYSLSEYVRILGQHRFIHHDLAHGLPLSPNVADFIYSSHFLEHLTHRQAIHLLKESYRVLKPGGVVRISVPDLEYAIQLYQQGKKTEMLESYFFVDSDESYYARHKYMYDFELLQVELQKIGFQEIRRQDFQKGLTPDLQHLDNRPQESLFIEAIKR